MSSEDLVSRVSPSFSQRYCTLSLLVSPGTIARVVGLDTIARELPEAEVTQWCKAGDVIPDNARGTQKQIATRITLAAEGLQELVSKIDFVNAIYDVIDTNGESMVVEKFDSATLLD